MFNVSIGRMDLARRNDRIESNEKHYDYAVLRHHFSGNWATLHRNAAPMTTCWRLQLANFVHLRVANRVSKHLHCWREKRMRFLSHKQWFTRFGLGNGERDVNSTCTFYAISKSARSHAKIWISSSFIGHRSGEDLAKALEGKSRTGKSIVAVAACITW